MTLCRLALCLCAGLLAAAPAAAQTVRVTVADAASGAPVEGAMVRVEDAAGELAQAGFTDRRGELRLRLDDPGPYAVRATRAGYTPGAEVVRVAPSGETAAAVRLAARPFVLDTVTVVGGTGAEVGRQTFERRRQTGNGIYLDSAYVAQRRATYPGDLLYAIPGIEVTAQRRTGYRLPTTRMGTRCLQFLVNGMPFYGGWPRFVPLEETLRRTDVVAVEVYREFAEVPRELQRLAWSGGQCGLVVYWTEDGWHSTSRGADPDAE
ncbi:MAG TPA: carboxypeptidase-like regulatory domain-containing protein [Longimicrobium sp.]